MSARFPIPKLVGVASEPRWLDAHLGELVASRLVDWVELRFDHIPAPSWELAFAQCARLSAAGITALGTLRLASDGGAWEQDDDARVEALDRILDHVDCIDLELSSRHVGRLVALARRKGVRTVVSHHDFARTPSLAELDALHASMVALGADFQKVAARVVEPVADTDTLFDFQRRHREGSTCVIGMGPDAVATRLHLPTVGGALAYAYLDVSTAPGQVSAETMSAHLRLTVPGFR